MLSFEVIAVGKLKNDPLFEVFEDYRRRLSSKFTLYEIDEKTHPRQIEKITARIRPDAAIIMLDERGSSISSRDFAGLIQTYQDEGVSLCQCIIGGADGLDDSLRKKARFLLSFGRQTWPHMLARVMLIEQLYRAQQILAGHPYHRD
jgi:23S rRNA (pseudouridine1915-N3)-methyltransferase